jgi:chorismate lyase
MTGQTVTVECLEMQDVGLFSAQSIPGKAYIPQTEEEFRTVRRQVFLKMSDEVERPYVYASSWWRRDVVDEYLKDRSKPIWTSLSSERTELFREIIELEHGHCGELERYAVVDHVLDVGIFFSSIAFSYCRHFGCKGPFWARTYIFWHNQKPLTVIYEVFSPRLHEFLGPSCSL